MWSEYLDDVEKFDTALTETWKEDANGLLTFTGIFSATVSAFIIESYKQLSPDSGNQTVFLLRQVSLQLTGLANGTIVQPQPDPAFSPGVSIICVNSIWLLSLVLSLTSALLATLTQQWARRYLHLPKIPSVPRDRARVRSFLFHGTLIYGIHYAVEIAPTLLHLSVLLFNIGLVIFFFTIFKTVAIIVLVFVALFGGMYFILTILPCLHHICPYRTPMSDIFWYLWHTFASLVEIFLRAILRRVHTVLVPRNIGVVTSRRQQKLTDWLERIDSDLQRHKKRLGDGFQGSIVKDALAAPQDIDVHALTWLFQLPALAEKGKMEKYVACIPRNTIVQLFGNPLQSGTPFLDPLSALLRSCAPGTVGLDDKTRKRRLLVCLDAIHHIAKVSTIPSGFSISRSLLNDLRIHFANIGLMRVLWADSDRSICVTARCICALLARNLLRKSQLEQSELAWLQDVMGKPSNTIYDQLGNYTAVDNMNIDSFVYGVFSHQTGYSELPSTQATLFIETLAILMSSGTRIADIRRETFDVKFECLIQRVDWNDHRHRDNIANNLRRIFQDIFPSAGPKPRSPST